VTAVELSIDQRGFSFKKMSKFSQTNISLKMIQRRKEFVSIKGSVGVEERVGDMKLLQLCTDGQVRQADLTAIFEFQNSQT